MGPAVRSPAPRFDGWLPIRFFWHEGEPRVDWCHFGDRALSEPFFRDSVEVALRQPFNEAFRRDTPASDLREWRCASPGIEKLASFTCSCSWHALLARRVGDGLDGQRCGPGRR